MLVGGCLESGGCLPVYVLQENQYKIFCLCFTGGAKKFLYKKPNARGGLFGEEEDDVTAKFNFISQPPATAGTAGQLLLLSHWIYFKKL